MTDSTYVMKNYNGINTSVNKDDLNKVTCLNNEKLKLEKKMEENEQYLTNILKSEIIKENNIRKVQEKINKKEEKINEFLTDKKEGIKFLENERYLDIQDEYEKNKIYNKMMLNFGHKIHMTDRKNTFNNFDNKKIDYNSNKNKKEELKDQIENYERKNENYKKRISQMFELDENNKNKISLPKEYKKPDIRQKKLIEIEDKLEMEKIKRESVFLNRINIMQSRLNDYMEKKEKKDSRIKQSLEKREKMREEKRILQDIRMDDIKEKILKANKRNEQKRMKKLENIEQKSLKDYAIKQEKLKIYEERKRMNQKTSEEKDAMKIKLQKIIRRNNNIEKIQDDKNFINKILYKD